MINKKLVSKKKLSLLVKKKEKFATKEGRMSTLIKILSFAAEDEMRLSLMQIS